MLSVFTNESRLDATDVGSVDELLLVLEELSDGGPPW